MRIRVKSESVDWCVWQELEYPLRDVPQVRFAALLYGRENGLFECHLDGQPVGVECRQLRRNQEILASMLGLVFRQEFVLGKPKRLEDRGVEGPNGDGGDATDFGRFPHMPESIEESAKD